MFPSIPKAQLYMVKTGDWNLNSSKMKNTNIVQKVVVKDGFHHLNIYRSPTVLKWFGEFVDKT